MCGHGVYPDLDHGGGDQRCQQDVNPDRRHPHAEDDAHHGGKAEQKKQVFASGLYQKNRQSEAQPRLVQDSDNHTGGSGDHHDVEHVDTRIRNGFSDIGQFHALALIAEQQTLYQQNGACRQRRNLRRPVHPEQRVDQNDKRDREYPSLKQYSAKCGDDRGIHPDDTELYCFEIGLEEQRGVVQNSRHQRGKVRPRYRGLQETRPSGRLPHPSPAASTGRRSTPRPLSPQRNARGNRRRASAGW